MDETISLLDFGDDLITLTFSVPDHRIDAHSLARILKAFASFAGSVDGHLNPGQSIKIEVVALSPGSFRTHLRRVASGSAGFFSDGAKQVFWGVLSGVLTFWILGGDADLVVSVDGDRVVVVSGDTTVILTHEVYEAARALAKQDDVAAQGKDFVQALDSDPEIQAVAIEATGRRDGGRLQIVRHDFGRLLSGFDARPQPRTRRREERARLVVTKPSFHRRPRKWAFEWNGVPVTASISDRAFVETLMKRGFLFGFGDVLEVEITYLQKYDDAIGDYLNDTSTYEIVRVLRHIPSTP